jgi:alginate O-acetyltransferase complex protein AlgI
MLFNSLAFLVFFPVVTLGYFLLPYRLRWAWLLAASCYFYTYFIPIYFLILACAIVVDYWAGLLIEESTGSRRKRWLVVNQQPARAASCDIQSHTEVNPGHGRIAVKLPK